DLLLSGTKLIGPRSGARELPSVEGSDAHFASSAVRELPIPPVRHTLGCGRGYCSRRECGGLGEKQAPCPPVSCPTLGEIVWRCRRRRFFAVGPLLFSASPRLRGEALLFRSRAIPPLPPPTPIPDWRRFERDHPNPFQIGVDFSDQASFGVDLVGS